MPSAGFTAVTVSGDLLNQLLTKSFPSRESHLKTYLLLHQPKVWFGPKCFTEEVVQTEFLEQNNESACCMFEFSISILFSHSWLGCIKTAEISSYCSPLLSSRMLSVLDPGQQS